MGRVLRPDWLGDSVESNLELGGARTVGAGPREGGKRTVGSRGPLAPSPE